MIVYYILFKFAKYQPNRSNIVGVVKPNVKGPLSKIPGKWRAI